MMYGSTCLDVFQILKSYLWKGLVPCKLVTIREFLDHKYTQKKSYQSREDTYWYTIQYYFFYKYTEQIYGLVNLNTDLSSYIMRNLVGNFVRKDESISKINRLCHYWVVYGWIHLDLSHILKDLCAKGVDPL